jgi:hypothetical protein
MKTSNKILLISSLSSMGIFGLVHLTLYARYEQGKILTENDLHEKQQALRMIQVPRYLALRGLLQINIIPSDTFYIEFRSSPDDNRVVLLKQADDAAITNGSTPSYHRKGDTLFIEGEKGQTVYQDNAGMMIQWPFPVVNVYCRNIGMIEVDGGQVTLVGAKRTADAAGDQTRLIARNSIVWVGEYHNWNDPVFPEFFDTLRIRAFKSTVLLNRFTVAAHLQASLTDNSLIEDRKIVIGRLLELSGDSTSRVTLTGKNLQKLQPDGP